MEDKLESLISNKNNKKWGTKFDFMDDIPTLYIGKSFYQIDHSDLSQFSKMSNIQKFEMAYWIERYQYKKASRLGFIIGTAFSILVILILLNVLS